MRALIFLVAVTIAMPAYAQTGLTPATQVGKLCTKAMQFRALGHGDGTAINTACGSTAARAATLAAGRPALNALIALVAVARAARDVRLQSAAP